MKTPSLCWPRPAMARCVTRCPSSIRRSLLRTHGEIGYRTEQRFHLELGLLKMAHAQRLLPIEQLLSEAGAASTARAASKPAIVPELRKAESPSAPRPGLVSPFAADSARKS